MLCFFMQTGRRKSHQQQVREGHLDAIHLKPWTSLGEVGRPGAVSPGAGLQKGAFSNPGPKRPSSSQAALALGNEGSSRRNSPLPSPGRLPESCLALH